MQRSTPGPSVATADFSVSARIHGNSATGEEDEEGSEHDDPVALTASAHDLLDSDPLDYSIADQASLKNQRKAQGGFQLPSFISSRLLGRIQTSSPPPPHTSILRRRTPTQVEGFQSDLNTPTAPNIQLNGKAFTHNSKEHSALDWSAEGPGRRVGYDDLTAIDWIFEYAKERQRLRVLHSSAEGVTRWLRQTLDGAQIWLLLILTGIATGVLAASIDVASDWLGDVKEGFCTNDKEGGKYYLNKAFCCWGYDEQAQCVDWLSWSGFFGVESTAGGWIIQYISFALFSVIMAVGASVLVENFAIYAKQSGIPEIKTVLGGFIIKRFINAWTLIVKSLGLCLAVASGLWLGKEGPLVHVACCCANLLLKLFSTLNNNEARKREILSAAAAAGISVAFGAPVGGVLFSLEQLSYYFPDKTMWQSFVCAMVAAVTLQAFNPFRTGKLVLYQVTYRTGWHGFELVPFILLGILGGIYGGLFIKLNMKVAEWRKFSRLGKKPILEVTIVALLTALINFPNKFMRAQTSELVYVLFAECVDLHDEQLGLCGTGRPAVVVSGLLAAALLGFLLASITFGLQIPAGIILPSMAIGALYGRAIGLVMRLWQRSYPGAFIFSSCEPDVPCVTAGTYAIIGAAAALGGATRMTVSIVVIMFELTGALTYVLPIMISVMISKWVGDAFGKRGIYESWIHFNGYPFLENRDASPVPDVGSSNLMTSVEDLVVINATGHTIATLNRILKTYPYRGFPVIADPHNAVLLGYIARTELAFALSSATNGPSNLPPTTPAFFSHEPLADPSRTLDLRPWMDQTPITLSAKSSLQITANMFFKLGLRYVIFCDKGFLKGLLTKKDLWYVLNGVEERVKVGKSFGILREETAGEGRNLLNDQRASTDEMEGPIG